MTRYLIFRLYAPLASWGGPAVGEERPSATYPGRAAIVGLLSAALGTRRDERQRLDALNASVHVAVKQRSPGQLLRDYHTVQVPPTRRGRRFLTRKDELSLPSRDLQTIISKRDYRADGLWTVALWPTEEAHGDYDLSALEAALAQPRFALYLGRRACPPGAPLAPRCVEASLLRAALDSEFDAVDTQTDARLRPNRDVLYTWENDPEALDGDHRGVESSQVWDRPLDRGRWQFAPRTEYRRYARPAGAS